MKRLIIFLLLFAAIKVAGQTTGYLRFDTVKIMKQNGTCELYIMNKTKDSTGGILTNVGNGLTSFKKPRVSGDTLFVGGDTLSIGRIDTAINVGSGVGVYKTKSGDSLIFKSSVEGYGINIANNTNDLTYEVDTSQIATQHDLTQVTTDANMLVGTTAPSSGTGINGDYFWNRMKSQMYIKSGGSWGSAYGYLIADTLQPISTSFYNGPIIKLKEIWDTAAMSWAMPSIQRNFNVPGNAALDYKDDPVMLWGWNVDAGGNRIDNWKAMMLWHHESNYQTLPFTVEPWFESHISVGFKPGTQGYNWGVGAERVESINASQYSYNIYKYNTKAREFWQWRIDSAQPHVTYFEINPDFARLLKKLAIDSIPLNDIWLQLDAVDIGSKMLAYGRNRYIFNRSGLADTAVLRADAGDFVFLRNLGSGRTLFDLPVGIGLSSDDANGRAPVQLSQVGEAFLHKYNDPTKNFSLNDHDGRYGITLNGAPNRKAYIDARNEDLGQDFNVYFTNNITVLDSISLPVRFNLEKSYLGSMTNALLIGTRGWEWNLNDIHRVNTVFTDSAASNGRRLADVVWSSVRTGGSTMTEMARLSHTGKFYLRFMDSLNAPTNMAWIDPVTGQIRKAAVPTGGGTSYIFAQSVAESAGTVTLLNDNATPGNSKLYGTNGSGVKGWYDQPSGGGATDHGALTGLADDDHTQYALLAGRTGGQTVIGSPSSGENLTLQSSSHATKGKILFGTSGYDEANNYLGLNTASPSGRLHISTPSLGVTPALAAGIILENPTAAAAGAQQISGSITRVAQGWKTTATAASQTVAFRDYVLPVQGAANPTANYILESSINGAGYTNQFIYRSDGTGSFPGAVTIAGTTINNSITANGSVTVAATGVFSHNGRGRIGSSADGQHTLFNAAQTGYTQLNFGGVAVTNGAIRVNGSDASILDFRKADNSAYTDINIAGRAFDATTWNGSNRAVSEDAIRDELQIPHYQILFSDNSSTTVANTTTETTLLGPGAGTAQYTNVTAGSVLSIKGSGTLSTDATPGTPEFNFSINNYSLGMNLTGLTGGLSNVYYDYTFELIPVASGTNQDVMVNCKVQVYETSTTLKNFAFAQLASGSFTNTGTLNADVTVQWSAADADNSVIGIKNVIEIYRKK